MKPTPKNLLLVAVLFIPILVTLAADLRHEHKRPVSVTYLSATRQLPPLPYHPFPKLPTASLGGGQFRYDDSGVDYTAIRQKAAKQAAKESNLQEPADLARRFLDTDLQLSTPVFAAGKIEFTIINAESNSMYDLFVCTNFPSTNAWAKAVRTARGQTNLSIAQPPGALMVFQLGTMQDSDADSLSDAFENLISHTSAFVPDTVQSAGTNTWLADLLTARPAKLDILSFNELSRTENLWDPCVETSYYINRTTDWTNDLGGFWTEHVREGTCYEGGPAQYFNSFADVTWDATTNACHRSKIEDGPWTLCLADLDGRVLAAPRDKPNLFVRVTNYYVLTTGQTVTNKITWNAETRTRFRTGGQCCPSGIMFTKSRPQSRPSCRMAAPATCRPPSSPSWASSWAPTATPTSAWPTIPPMMSRPRRPTSTITATPCGWTK